MVGWEKGDKDEPLASSAENQIPIFPRMLLGFANLVKKNFSVAIDEMRKARELSGDATLMLAFLGDAYAAARKPEEARGILEELTARSRKEYVSAYLRARAYASLGDLDKAFELANEACERRDEVLILIKIDPSFVPYRSDPRYQALLKKIGLE